LVEHFLQRSKIHCNGTSMMNSVTSIVETLRT